MATKRIETQLTIKANDKYSSALKRMETVTGKFADGVRTEFGRLQGMRGSLKLIEDFKATQARSDKAREAFERQKEEVRRLRREMQKVKRPTAAMAREFERAQKKATRLREAHQRQKIALHDMGQKLRDAKINTADLGAEQRRLAASSDRMTTALGQSMGRMQRLQTMQARIAGARERMDRSLATSANLSFVGGASMQTGRRILTALSDVSGRAGDLEDQFADFQNLTGIDDTRLVQLREDLDGLRDVTKTSVSEMLDGLAVLAGKGMGFEDALASLSAVGRAAKATKTSVDEMGASGFALYDNLKVAPEEFRKAFDIMAMGGKEGGFELSAMARKFPEITAGARALKMEGLDSVAQLTAALQIAMKSAGSEDQAATNLSNFLGKLTSPETVRRFAKMGVSIEDELRKAAKNGVSPFEHMLGVIDDLTGGDALKMGELFGDKQVLDFLRAMIPNFEEYRRIKDAALSADGVVDADLENLLDTFKESRTQLGESVGKLFSLPPEVLESFTSLFQTADAIVERMIVWKKENPKLVKGLFVGAAALGAMAVAGGALLTAGAGLIGTMAVLRFGLVGLGARAAFAAGDLVGVGGAFKGLTKLPRFALSKLVTPLKWTSRMVPPIAWGVLGRKLVWDNLIEPLGWEKYFPEFQWSNFIGSFSWAESGLSVDWSGFWASLRESAEVFLPHYWLSNLLSDQVNEAARSISWSTLFSGNDGAPKRIRESLPNDPSIRAAADTVYRFAGDGSLPTPDAVKVLSDHAASLRADLAAAQANLEAMGAGPAGPYDLPSPQRQIAQQRVDQLTRDLADVEAALADTKEGAAELGEAMRILDGTEVTPEINTHSFDRALAKLQRLADGMRSLPSAVGAAPAPRPAGARAGGGPVRMGLPYLVNENTPRSEWFVPSLSGGILNVSQAQSAFRSHLSAIAPGPIRRSSELARLHRGAQGLRAASLAVLTSSALAAPAAAQPAPPGAGAVTVQIENFTVHVPSGVSDPEAIADLVSDRIGQRVAATMSASFSD